MEIKGQATTACGKIIFITEDAKRHLSAHPDVLEFLEEAVSKVVIPDGVIYFEKAINLGRIVGESKLVKTEAILPDQKTSFAFRLERKYPSRVILNKKGIPCDSVTVEIKFNELGKKYFLSTAYVGYPCPYELFYIENKTSADFKTALDFWCNHALVYDSKIMGSAFESSWENELKNKI